MGRLRMGRCASYGAVGRAAVQNLSAGLIGKRSSAAEPAGTNQED